MSVSWSNIEKNFIARSGCQASYAGERIPTVEVENIYELGKLVAFRFLEWVAHNPTGVVALPTGRTPEFFIKTLEKYKERWNDPAVQEEVQSYGFTQTSYPDTTQLRFVMLDEFFPMAPTHRNSFCRYIRAFYVKMLGIKPENVLTFDLIEEKVLTLEDLNVFEGDVDLSLLTREPANDDERAKKAVLLKAQKYCEVYESKVAAWGGIGFFLGGIGPDGHIAFNQEGDDLHSRTRLVNFNYPSAAAAASDLGGIERARGKAAMTIGLATITASPTATLIIMAAGEGKANVVRAALEDEQHPSRPASSLHGHNGARFYITHGAATLLTDRRAARIAAISSQDCVRWALEHLSGINAGTPANLTLPPADYLQIETLLYDISLKTRIAVHDLKTSDLSSVAGITYPSFFYEELTFRVLVTCAARRLREKVAGGLLSCSVTGESILHTAPHHDDIMLSYHGAMHEMLGRQEAGTVYNADAPRSPVKRGTGGAFDHITRLGEKYNRNINHFAYLTSGFHSVNDEFLWKKVHGVCAPELSFGFLESAVLSGELTRDYDDLMIQFRAAFFARDFEQQEYIENVIFLRKIAEVWNIRVTQSYGGLVAELKERVAWLLNDYLPNHSPGDAVPKDMQILKGCMRETEVDRVWALSKMPMNRIHHLRSKFYTDDFFTPMPSLEDDAMPMANLIKARQPNLLTVAFDPEGTGPDTHYKVLQVVAAGLRIALNRNDLLNPNPLVWGYRNVWFTFTPSDATIMIPVSASDLDLMHDTFMSCFTTQKTASFPSPYYDGPFSAWARHLQKGQKDTLQILTGEKFFKEHLDERVRNAAGFIFIKAMYAQQFLKEVEELKSKFENTGSA